LQWQLDRSLAEHAGQIGTKSPKKKALQRCKASFRLFFLAPRPGLEPGTNGLTENQALKIFL
jgi:hypothetical protein